MTPSTAARLRKKLAAWFRQHGRDLPWRASSDAWAVLVSEFLLQQTTVAAVSPRFAEWTRRFPTPAAMAAAPLDEVLHLWQGLGYYRRADSLHRAAQTIVARHGGQVPDKAAALEALPGVGRYTAAAVLAFAFDRAVPVVDANIERVLARLGDIRLPARSAAGRARIEELAIALLPRRGGALHTAALMDLGAVVCRSGQPDCNACPVRAFCQARDPAALPVLALRRRTVRLVEHRALYIRGGKIALAQSAGPRWRGLWVLPETAATGPVIAEHCHAITHHHVTMRLIGCSRRPPGTALFPVERLPAMPSPLAKALAAQPFAQRGERAAARTGTRARGDAGV